MILGHFTFKCDQFECDREAVTATEHNHLKTYPRAPRLPSGWTVVTVYDRSLIFCDCHNVLVEDPDTESPTDQPDKNDPILSNE